MNDELILRQAKALGDPTRLHILRFLGCCTREVAIGDQGDAQGVNAGEVCCHVSGDEKINSTISHHLHELEEAGLIRITRQGKYRRCELSGDAFGALGEAIRGLATPTSGDACACACACCGSACRA